MKYGKAWKELREYVEETYEQHEISKNMLAETGMDTESLSHRLDLLKTLRNKLDELEEEYA